MRPAAEVSRLIVRDEVAKQVRHAIRRPCQRVFIGKYHTKDAGYSVYVQVEKEK